MSFRYHFVGLNFKESYLCRMETLIKQIIVAGLVIVMLGLINSNSVWARDDGGHGGGFGGNFRGNGGHEGGEFRGNFRGNDRHEGGEFGGNFGGNGKHEGGNFGGNGRHYSRSLGYYGSFYYSPYIYLPTVPQPQTNYWYYCQDPEGYYPDVNECPDGWQQVAPNYRYYCQDPEGYYPDVDVCPDGWQQVAPQPDED